MDNHSRPASFSQARRKFLGVGAGSLLSSLTTLRYASAEGGGTEESLADQFQHDFAEFGYNNYMVEIAEEIDTGVVRGRGRDVAAKFGDGIEGFRRAWGLEDVYRLDWNTLSLDALGSRADGQRIARTRFRLDCGFPVVALIGEGQGQIRKGTALLLHGMGTTPERSMGLESPDYMRHIGMRLMQQGYTVVCPFFPHAGNFSSVAQLGLQLAASSIAFHNVAVSIALACLDAAVKCAGAEAGRIYCYGVSIGGLIGLHASLLDMRITALVLSGYVREDKSLLDQGVYYSMLRQGEIYPTLFNPGAWRYGLEEALKLWMPMPLFIEVGLGDVMSGAAQGRDRVLKRIQDGYAAIGSRENFGFERFPGGHEVDGTAAIGWLKRLS